MLALGKSEAQIASARARVKAAVEELEKKELNSLEMRRNAERFSQDRFSREIKAFLHDVAPEVMHATESI